MSLRNMLDQALLGRQAGKSFQAVLICSGWSSRLNP